MRSGERAVDDELLKAQGGGDHVGDGGISVSAGEAIEDATGEVEGGQEGDGVLPALGDAGARCYVARIAHLGENVLHDALRD